MPPPDDLSAPPSPDDILGPSIATAPPTPAQVPPADPADILQDGDRFKVAATHGLAQDPTRAARLLAAQDRTGLPTELLDPHLDEVEQAVRARDFDADKYRRDSPVVAQAIADNPALAGLARDDLPQLANLERLIRADPRYSYTPGGQIVEDLGGGLGHVHQNLREFRDALISQGVAADVAQRRAQAISDDFGNAQAVSAGFLGSVGATLGAFGNRQFAEGAADLGRASQENHPGIVGDLLRGAGSMAADLPTLLVPGGALARSLSAVPKMLEARAALGEGYRIAGGFEDAWKAADAGDHALAERLAQATIATKASKGVAEASQLSTLAQHFLTGAASMQGFALRDAANHAQDGDVGQALGAWAADTGIAAGFGPVGAARALMLRGGEEVASKAAVGGAGFLLKQAGLNASQNATFALSDAIQAYASGRDPHALDAEKLGPALASAGVFGAAMGAVFSSPEAWAHVATMKRLAGDQGYQRVAAMATAQRLGEIAKQADDMQALELNQPAVQTLVQKLAENGSDIKTLYLDAQAVRDRFAPTVDAAGGVDAQQPPKQTAREWVGQVTGDPVAFDKAIASGSQIAVPIESFFAQVARSDHRDWFLSEARRLPGATNDREALAGWKADGEKARAEAQGQINSAAPDEVAAKADAMRQSADLVQAEIERQQVAADVPAVEAKRNAQTLADYFHASAQRFKAEGVHLDPWEMYQGAGLSVERGTAEDAARPASDGTMEQPASPLSPEHAAIESRFAQQIASDVDRAARDYAALPETEGGRVINTDLVRELSADYQKDRTANAAAVHEPASALADLLYRRALAKPPEHGVVTFLGGGGGSGKSSALDTKGRDAVFDGTMGGYDSSRRRIDEALASGRRVRVDYVHRPVDLATRGVIKRAVHGDGRSVPIDAVAEAHYRSQRTVLRLADEFRNDPRVAFRILDNSGAHGEPLQVRSVDWLDSQRYTSAEAVREQAQSILEAERVAGSVPDRVHQALAQRAVGAGSGRGGGAVRGEPAPQRSEGRPEGLDQPGDQAPRARIVLGKGSARIILFPGRDRTSFMHEAAHFMLEHMHQLAERADAPAALKADLAAFREWLGVKPGEKLTREQHEQFAEGWETFVMTGKAPSLGLRDAFRRFAKWFTDVYKSLSSRVQLPQHVHDLFGRLVATDQEIAEAKQEEAPQLFDDQASFNGDEKAWNDYVDLLAKAKQRAHDILEGEMTQRIRDEEGADYQEERAKVREATAKTVDNLPPFRAMNVLRGKWPEDLKALKPERPVKLSREDIVEHYGRTYPDRSAEDVARAGQAALDRLPGPQRDGEPTKANRGTRLYSDDDFAWKLDDAADLFGFSSGDALYQALVGMPDREAMIEQETQKEMDRRRPDPFNDGSARERARLALANKDRLKVMEMEAAALAKRTDQMPTESALLAAVARSEIDKTPSFRLNPEVHRVAMQKAGKASARAFAEAKHATDEQARRRWLLEAQANKSREILSFHLYRAATYAQRAEQKGGEYLSTFDKLDKRERIGKSGGETWVVRWEDPATRQPQSQEFKNQAEAVERAKSVPGGDVVRSGYLEQIDGLMEQVSLRRPSNAQLQRRESLRDFIRRKSDDGDALVVSDDLVKDLGTKHWRELTVAQQRDLVDAVKNLEKLANQQNRLLTNERKVKLDEAVSEAVATIKENKPAVITRKIGDGIVDSAQDAFGRYLAAHRKVASLLYEADGYKYGPLYDLWQRRLNDADNVERAMIEKDSAALAHLVKEWGKVRPGDPFSLNWRRMEPSVGVELNHWAKIMVAMNWGNAGNRERLMKGYGWSPAQVEALIDTLDKKDMEFVQGALDLVNSHWQDIKAKVERVTGIAPEKVESLPIITRHGVFRGGYFPAKYDARTLKGKDPALDEQASITKMGERLWSTTQRGHTKARTDAPEGAQILLAPSVITQHLNQVGHDLAFHETLIDLNRVLRHDDFRQAVEQHMGDGAFRQMKTQLRDVAAGVHGSETGLDKLLEYTRQGVNFAARGFNLATGLQQVAGMPQVVVRVGPKYFAKALVRMFSDGDSLDNGVHFAESKSIALRNRSKTFDKNRSDAVSGVGLRGPIRKTIDGAGYYFWTKSFQILDAHTWLAGYLKAMDEEPLAGATAEQHEARAISIADQTVTDIQGSGATKDLPAIMRGGALAQVFTSNMSWWLANYNITAEAINRAKSGDLADIARTGATLFVLYGVQVAAWAALDAALTGKDADAWKDPLALAKKLSGDAAYTAASSMVLLRDLADSLSAGKEFKGPAGLKSMQYFADTIGGVWHATKDHGSEAADEAAREKLLESSVRSAGVLFHLPSRMLLQMLDAANAAQQPGGSPISTAIFGKPPKQGKQ